MQTKQAIQTSANVIRITSVAAGDVYKRFDDSSDDRVYYGVIQAVHNDGENTIIEAVEYSYRYYDVSVEYKIMRGQKDYILFPAEPAELNLELEKARDRKLKEIEGSKKKIVENEKLLLEIDGLVSGETLKGLKSASYKEMTQAEYTRKMKELSA